MTAELFDSDEDVSPLDSDEDAPFVHDQKSAQVDASPHRRKEDWDASAAEENEDIRDPFTGEWGSGDDEVDRPAKILPMELQEDANNGEEHVQPLEDWEASERKEREESFQPDNPGAAELVDSAEDRVRQPNVLGARQPNVLDDDSSGEHSRSAPQELGQEFDNSDFQVDRAQEPPLEQQNAVPDNLDPDQQQGQLAGANDSEQDFDESDSQPVLEKNVVEEQQNGVRDQQRGEAEEDDSEQDMAQQVAPGQEESWGNYEDWKEDLTDTGRGPNFYGNTFKAVDHVTSAVERAGPAIGTAKREASSLLDHSDRYNQALDKLSHGLKEFNVGVKNFREVTAKRHTRNTKHLSEQLAKGLQTGLAGFGPE